MIAGVVAVPWYYIVIIICIIIGPFDALYLYIKAQKRKEKKDPPEDRN